MKERDINVTYHRTINTGNYSSVKIGGGFSRELSLDENRKEEFLRDFKQLRHIIIDLAKKEV